jgi:hypothetical protein
MGGAWTEERMKKIAMTLGAGGLVLILAGCAHDGYYGGGYGYNGGYGYGYGYNGGSYGGRYRDYDYRRDRDRNYGRRDNYYRR